MMKETKEALSVVVYLVIILTVLGTSIYGAVLLFKASLILGVAILWYPRPMLFFGVLGILGHPEAAKLVANLLHLPW